MVDVGICLSMFNQAFSFENLLAAYRRAKKGKQARHEVARFGYNLEQSLIELRDHLYSGTYKHGQYREFTVADSKRRDIKAAPFCDRVMHQALTVALEPLFERRFIYDSYACRRNKGTHKAIKRFADFSRSSTYVLSMDISKYFASIDHGILLRLLSRRVTDDSVFSLCRVVIESSENSRGKGIPIGNLTSQLFANVYLDVLDQHVKHNLHFRHYIRYMDDFVFFHNDKAFLHNLKEEITGFLSDKLELTAHPHKAQVVPISLGVNWLGLRLFPHHQRLRQSTVARFLKRAHRAKKSEGALSDDTIRSWVSWTKNADSYGLRSSLAIRFNDKRFVR